MANTPEFLVLTGLLGSGKSTYGKRYAEENNATYLSSDEIRKELTGSEECFDKDGEVFSLMLQRAKDSLLNGKSTVYDATNLSSKRRISLLKSLGSIECKKNCTIICTPIDICLKQNRNRERCVPEAVIKDMRKRFTPPMKFEGFDNVDLYYPDKNYENFNGNTGSYIEEMKTANHDNPHHKETIGEHSVLVKEKLDTCDYAMEIAALIHDCGKKETLEMIKKYNALLEENKELRSELVKIQDDHLALLKKHSQLQSECITLLGATIMKEQGVLQKV